MNMQKKIEQYLRAAPKPPAPDGLLDKLEADVSAQDIKTHRLSLRRWFAPTGRSISPWRVAAAAVIALAVLLPLSYGATKLIKRFASTSQLPTITVDFPGNGALSPDGKYFAGTTWDSELVIINISTGEQQKLGKEFYGTVVWSADGSEIAVKRGGTGEQRGLMAVSVKTGEVRTLVRRMGSFVDWSRNGKFVLNARRGNAVMLHNLEKGGRDGERTSLAEETGVWSSPCFSPNSNWVSYITQKDSRSILHLQEINGTSHVEYSDFPGQISQPIWSPDGRHIVFTGTESGVDRQYKDLWALRVKDSQFVGTPFPVVPDIEQIRYYNWAQNGQLAYRTGFKLGGIFTLAVDLQTGKATGAPRRLVRRSGLDSYCWSPDGKQMATPQSSDMSLISTRNGETLLNLSLSGIKNIGRGMSWSPDGKWIAFCGINKEKQTGIYLIGVQGGDVRLLVALEKLPPNYDPTWSPDSKNIAYGHNNNVYVLNIEDVRPNRITNSPEEPKKPRMKEESVYVGRPVFAPDGRSVAYLTGQRKDGKSIEKVLMTTIDGQETREIFKLKTENMTINIFDLSPDGRHIVFTPGNNEIWCAPTDGGEPFKIGDISNVGDNAWAWMPKWSPKGDAITFIVTCEKYQYWVMENFLPTD